MPVSSDPVRAAIQSQAVCAVVPQQIRAAELPRAANPPLPRSADSSAPAQPASNPPTETESAATAPLKQLASVPPAIEDAPVAFSARLTPIVPEFPYVTSSSPQIAAGEAAKQQSPPPTAAEAVAEMPPMPPPEPVKRSEAAQPPSRSAVTPQKSHESENVASSTPSASPAPADFARAFVNAAPQVPAPDPKQPAAPSVNVADALRTSEPPAPPAAMPSAPVQQIAVRIAPAGAVPVDLHVSQRAGEIHVSVRTADAAMQTSLRQDLPTLVNSLERAGYRAEMFSSRDTAVHAASPAMNFRDDRAQTGSNGAGSNGRGGSGTFSQEGQQQPRRDPRRKNWLEELENSK